MMWLVTIIHGLIILGLIWQFSKRFRHSSIFPYFWYGVAWKLLNGLAFGWLYKHYFLEGDTWQYFYDAQAYAEWAVRAPGAYIESLATGNLPEAMSENFRLSAQPRALFMARLISPLVLVTAGNYWITSIYLSMFSFFGLWLIADKLSGNYPGSRKAAVWAFLFMPGTIFWSAGISKEAIFAAGWGCLIAYLWPYFAGYRFPKFWQAILLTLLALVLFNLKYYYMAVLIPALAAVIMAYYLIRPSSPYKSWWWLSFFVAFISLASLLHPNLHLANFLGVVKYNATQIVSKSGPQVLIHFMELDDAVWWSLINAPKALLSGLFRPSLLDWAGIWQNLAALENTFTLIMVLGALKNWRAMDWKNSWWLPCAVYILLLAILLSLSTPNMGTLVRYKVSFMPLFVFLILSKNPWWEKIAGYVSSA